MFVVFWRMTESSSIDPGADQFAIYETAQEAAENYAGLVALPKCHCAGWAPITGAATEPHWLQSTPVSEFDAMRAEYESFIISGGWADESDDAMGMLYRNDLTPAERRWLSDFVRRWDDMESRAASVRRLLENPPHPMTESRRVALVMQRDAIGA